MRSTGLRGVLDQDRRSCSRGTLTQVEVEERVESELPFGRLVGQASASQPWKSCFVGSFDIRVPLQRTSRFATCLLCNGFVRFGWLGLQLITKGLLWLAVCIRYPGQLWKLLMSRC